MQTGINADKRERGMIDDTDVAKLVEFMQHTMANNFIVDINMKFNTIPAQIKWAKRRFGIKYVIIDYVQLLELPSRKDRHTALKEVTRRLKTEVCQELQIPVLLIAQQSDAAHDDKIPLGRRIAESKQMQADADVVMAMRRRTDKEIEVDPGGGDILLNLDKVRYSRDKVMVPINFNSVSLTMEERDAKIK